KPAEAGFYVNQVKLTDKSALYPISSGTRSGGMRVVAHNVSHPVSHLKWDDQLQLIFLLPIVTR
ncbi:hypothetical protein ACIQP4_001588, partial [Escherichia coli]